MKLPGVPAVKMPTLSKREVVLVTLFLLLFLATLYDKFIFEPQWNKIIQLRQELDKQQKILNLRLSQGWDNIFELEEQSEKMRSGIDQLYLTVPNIKDEPKLLVDFYKLTGSNYLGTETIKFSELSKVKDQAYSVFNVSLEVTGNNSDIYNFIDALEKYPRSHRISEITFEPQTSLNSKCSLTVEFYVLHEMQPDPPTYPFMEGLYGKGQPYQIFDFFNREKDVPAQEPTGLPTEPIQSESLPAIPSVNSDSEMPEWLRVDGS